MSVLTSKLEHKDFLKYFELPNMIKYAVVDLATGNILSEDSGYTYNPVAYKKGQEPDLFSKYRGDKSLLDFCTLSEDVPYAWEVPLNGHTGHKGFDNFSSDFRDFADLSKTRRLAVLPLTITFDKATDKAAANIHSSWDEVQFRNDDNMLPPIVPTVSKHSVYARVKGQNISELVCFRTNATYRIQTKYGSSYMFTAWDYCFNQEGLRARLHETREPLSKSGYTLITSRYVEATRSKKIVVLPTIEFEVNPYDEMQKEPSKLYTESVLMDTQKVFSLEANDAYINNHGGVCMIYTLPLVIMNPHSRINLETIEKGDIINVRGEGSHVGCYFVERILQPARDWPFIIIHRCV